MIQTVDCNTSCTKCNGVILFEEFLLFIYLFAFYDLDIVNVFISRLAFETVVVFICTVSVPKRKNPLLTHKLKKNPLEII